MNWIAQMTMRRARLDADNEAFFRNRQPAVLRDFYPQMVSVATLSLAGAYFLISGDLGIFAMVALLATAALLTGQFRLSARFWETSVAEQD